MGKRREIGSMKRIRPREGLIAPLSRCYIEPKRDPMSIKELTILGLLALGTGGWPGGARAQAPVRPIPAPVLELLDVAARSGTVV